MRKMMTILLGALAPSVGMAMAARADGPDVTVFNNNQKAAWVTFYYSSGDMQRGHGCVPANGGTWSKRIEIGADWGSLLGGDDESIVVVRHEYKANLDCTGQTLVDTKRNVRYKMPLNGPFHIYVPPRKF